MPIDIVPNVSKPWQLPQHAGNQDAPTFHLRSLTARTMLELQNVENPGTGMWLLALAACVGIDGLTLAGKAVDSAPMPQRRVAGVTIPAGGIDEELLDALPPEWVALIAQEVAQRHRVTAEDLGK